MIVKKIDSLYNQGIEKIEGSKNLYYAISTSDELYEVRDVFIPCNDKLYGNEISFLIYPECRIYKPFGRIEGIYYQNMSVVYYAGYVYFLQGDFNENLINLFRWDPNVEFVELVTSLDANEICLYNLRIHIVPPLICADDIEKGTVEIYYPERLSFSINGKENFSYRDGEKFYFSSWHEEGYDSNGNREGEYKYWEEFIVKNRDGKIIEKGKGCMMLMPDGQLLIL